VRDATAFNSAQKRRTHKICRSDGFGRTLTEIIGKNVERVTGIEPAWPAWKAGTLPLSYTRKGADFIAYFRDFTAKLTAF
jgi:hypothetical protein